MTRFWKIRCVVTPPQTTKFTWTVNALALFLPPERNAIEILCVRCFYCVDVEGPEHDALDSFRPNDFGTWTQNWPGKHVKAPLFFCITKVCGGAVCRPLRCSKISHRQSVAASSNGRTLQIAVLDSCRGIFSFHFYLSFFRFLFVCICVSVCSVFHFRISSIVSLELS